MRVLAESLPEYRTLVEAITRTTADAMGCYCGLALVTADRQLVESVSFHDPDPEAQALLQVGLERPPVRLDSDLPSAQVIRSGKPLLLREFPEQLKKARVRPEYRDRIEALEVQSLVLVPLRLRGESIGFLSLMRHGAGVAALDERDIEFAQTLADQASLAIANNRLVASLQQELEERRRAEQVLRATEEQLRQSQKMDALGRLAGGVAHDFNNLLCVVLTNSSTLVDELGPDHPLRGEARDIKVAGERAAELTRQLLALSRQQVVETRVLRLDGAVTAMQDLVRRLVGSDVEVRVTHEGDPANVRVDPGHLEQVILNLVVNARDAMPRGGLLTLATESVEVAAGNQEIPPGSYAKLTVRDTGTGIDPETLGRIFEPFFTTKPRGKGTGLGLSTVFGIVRQAGGVLTVESEPGKGTAFSAYLPRSFDKPTPITRPVAITQFDGTETVLLVEDEPQVRNVVRTVLRRNGYRVLEAGDGEEGLRVAESFGGIIHLLLTDMVMPKTNGRELAQRVAKSRPHMQVIYMSGFSEVAEGLELPGRPLRILQKPLTPGSILKKVREALDESRLEAS